MAASCYNFEKQECGGHKQKWGTIDLALCTHFVQRKDDLNYSRDP